MWEDAGCVGKTRLFFSYAADEQAYAKSICGRCPHLDECHAGAVERGETHGVWGGQVFEKHSRAAWRREQKQRREKRKEAA